MTGRHTLVETRRNLARLLQGEAHSDAVAMFATDWQRSEVVELDATLCVRAAALAERSGVRTLDALHLAAAQSARVAAMVTYDVRLSEAAEGEGLVVAAPGMG